MSSEWLLGDAPRFDEATQYSYDWFLWTMSEIDHAITVVKLLEAEAVKDRTIQELHRDPKPSWFVHYDHGDNYVLWGNDKNPIINLDNLQELAGMRVYNMNCLSGSPDGLGGHALAAGILEFLGYRDIYSFTLDSLEEHKQATGFGLIKAITEGKQLKDIVEEMRQNGYNLADKLNAEGKWPAASALVTDMNNLICYAEGAPPPPEPECTVSRGLLHLFGWEGLRKFRAMRQRLFPESPL